ncbi:MAG: 50S ribosomal protein L5 [Candidatus Micrarchaeota archaeon]
MSMSEVRIDKVTLNIGVGEGGQKLENAKILLERLSGRKAVPTAARVRNPVFKIRKGEPIGAKVTLRRGAALEFLKKSLDAVDSKLPARVFDNSGNFAFGIREYIDFPGAKYDPKIGILGFDVCVTLAKPGKRVEARRRARARIPRAHRVRKEEAMEFLRKNFNVTIE